MRILIADDDPVIRKQLEETVAKHEYDIISCVDGLEAWEKIQSADAPTLMILDWSMPGFSGIELCKKIRALKNEPEPYLILLTVKSDVNDVIEGLDSGADDYITKPFYPHELHARIKTGLRSIKLQEELIEAKNILKIESEQSLAEYKKAMDASAYVSKSDLAGKITYVNDALCSISGYTRDELIGKPHKIFRDKDTPKVIYKTMWKEIEDKKIWRGSLKNIKKDGSYFYIYETIIPILSTDGKTLEYIASRYDITELIEKRKTLEKHYETDTLTKLGNRFKLLNDIEDSKDPSLAILDIDSFKEINDFYGHDIGDYVIIEVAKRLANYSNNQFVEVYRLQGDQFAFLYKEYAIKKIFENIIEELIEDVTNKPIFFQQHEILFGVTAGLALEKTDLFIDADIALKMAKQSKKNYITYSKNYNIEKEYENNLEWTKKIKKALEEDRIVAFFQPIYNQHSKKIEKFEALVRMIEVDGKIISPFFFLEISKKAKLYSKITMLMIDKTIEAAKTYDYEFSVNLTIDDILNKEVTNYFMQSVMSSNIGHKIVIEIVETQGIENFNEFYSFIEKVKKLGCKLAIDDFGTGYSNFEYLLKLDADYIKIDGSLIKDIDNNEHMRLIAETIVSFAKTANMKTIAEFVSHKEIADIVEEIDVDYSQGYYIGKPMAYDELSTL